MKKIIIIGGGIAGLSAGIYAKLNNYDVEIYEKNHEAGGFLTSWYRDGNVIDGCLHWMVGTKENTKLNRIWKTVGGLEDTEIICPNSFYQVVFGNQTLTFYRDIDKMQKELLSYSVSDNDKDLVNALIDAIKEIGEAVVPSDIPFELITKATPPNMALMRKLKRFLSMNVEDLANLFDSEMLKFAFLNSLVDKKFSVHYLLQTLSNFTIGNADLPLNGSHSVRDKMVNKFISLGGKITYNAQVEEIVVENNLTKGVVVDAQFHSADYVIPACDIHHTFNNLLKNKFNNPYQDFDKDKQSFPTYSFIVASFKTKRSFKDSEIATVYKTNEYSLFGKNYDVLPVRHFGYNDQFVCDGYTTVSVMLPTYEQDYEYLKGLNKQEYKAFKANFAQIFKDKLQEIYQEEFILIDTLTPLTYERFINSYKGSFMTYAIGARKRQVLHSSLVEGLDNLVLANQWLVMPGGTPIAVIAGKFAVQHILNKDGRNYLI